MAAPRAKPLTCSTGDRGGEAISAADALAGRHLIASKPPRYEYRARHRVIADLVVSRLQANGELAEAIAGVAFAAATKVPPGGDRESRTYRLLVRCISHDFLGQVLAPADARRVYEDLENVLAHDYHYWLQRGSLEVERGDLRLGEHFLRQAMALGGHDHRVRTEYAYLLLAKACDEGGPRATEWANEGLDLVRGVISTRGNSDYHCYHVFGSQGLSWSRRGPLSRAERSELLDEAVKSVSEGVGRYPFIGELRKLLADLQRERLLLTVPPGSGHV